MRKIGASLNGLISRSVVVLLVVEKSRLVPEGET